MSGGHVAHDAPVGAPAAGGLGGLKVTVQLGYHHPVCIVEPDYGDEVEGALEIAGVPGYVFPQVFAARWDDPDSYPAVVTLQVEVKPWTGASVIRVVSEARIEEDYWDGLWFDSPYEYLPPLPELRVPTLMREALAQAAMPEERPLQAEMGQHADVVRELLRVRRTPKISRGEWNRLREAYREARATPELTRAFERRAYVFERLHAAYPDEWPRRDGRAPDYDRLRPFIAEIDEVS